MMMPSLVSDLAKHVHCSAQSLALGALNAWTLPLSTPAIGSMVTLMSAGRRAANAVLHMGHAQLCHMDQPPCSHMLRSMGCI